MTEKKEGVFRIGDVVSAVHYDPATRALTIWAPNGVVVGFDRTEITDSPSRKPKRHLTAVHVQRTTEGMDARFEYKAFRPDFVFHNPNRAQEKVLDPQTRLDADLQIDERIGYTVSNESAIPTEG